MIENATVLGASGAIGKAVTDALISRNISTKILVRNKDRFLSLYPDGKLPGRVNAVEGDLDSNQALASVFEYSDTIFVCFNAPYNRWSVDLTRWISRVSDLAAALQARIVFPGNVYNFGKTGPEPITEEHPQKTHTVKGQLRIALEQRLARAAMEGATLTIVRFPDVYGPAVFSKLIMSVFQSALEDKKCRWFGNPHSLHDFICAIDAGEAMVRAALEPRAADTVLHVPGPEPISSHDWIKLIYKEANSTLDSYYNITSNLMFRLLGIFNKQENEFREMLYLYEKPILLDGTKYEQIVGLSPVRGYQETIQETIDWYRFYFKL